MCISLYGLEAIGAGQNNNENAVLWFSTALPYAHQAAAHGVVVSAALTSNSRTFYAFAFYVAGMSAFCVRMQHFECTAVLIAVQQQHHVVTWKELCCPLYIVRTNCHLPN